MNPTLAPADPHPTFLRDFAETRGFLLGRPNRFAVTPDGSAVLFLRSSARSPQHGLFEHDVASGKTAEVVTPAQILGGSQETVSDAERARRERLRIADSGFAAFALSPDGASILVNLSNRLFLISRASRKVRALTQPGPDAIIDPRFSPDGKNIAFVRGHDLFVQEVTGTGPARAVTRGGTEDLMHGLAEFVAEEEMARHEGYWWSPDSKRLAYAEVDQRAVERCSIVDVAHPERPARVFPYPRPGKPNAVVRLGIVALGTRKLPARPGRTIWVDWDREQYPYLARVLWDVPTAPLSVLVQTRDQREMVLFAVDETTGKTRRLALERDDAWVNLDRDLPRWLPDGSGFLWVSEHTGRRELELRAPDGVTKVVLIPGAAGFQSVAHVCMEGRRACIHALVGDAVSNVLVRAYSDGGAIHSVTRDHAEHAPVFSRQGNVFVDARTAIDAWPEVRVCRHDGQAQGGLPSVALDPPFPINVELTTVGEAKFHAAIVRPQAFDPARRYPVIVHVYGGPHSLMVKSDRRNYVLAQWMADHGAMVVAIDNRGTPRRDRAWERSIKGNLGEAALGDQVAGLQALGARYRQMDLSRVGIHGWSFGGTMSALAVLRRPDVYKVAVAGAPVIDWLDYDTHYTERYLDLPERNPKGYEASSPLHYAAQLSRPLLIIHGTADDNVYAFHSKKLTDALTRADRAFEYMPLPGVTHQLADPRVRELVWRRTTEFLLSHLLSQLGG